MKQTRMDFPSRLNHKQNVIHLLWRLVKPKRKELKRGKKMSNEISQ